MTTSNRRFYLLGLIFSLGGCTVGNWRICGPQTPAIYCDAKALNEMLNPRPSIDKWEKPGGSPSEKLADWIDCGGQPDGNFVPTEAMQDVWRGLEETSKLSAYQLARVQFQRCVLGKGLRWTGLCEYESQKVWPVCGAP
jgi:hypothetical protein